MQEHDPDPADIVEPAGAAAGSDAPLDDATEPHHHAALPVQPAPVDAGAGAAPAATRPPKGPGRLRRAGAWIRDHYLQADPRTLGLFRLFLGFLVCGDCVRHWK